MQGGYRNSSFSVFCFLYTSDSSQGIHYFTEGKIMLLSEEALPRCQAEIRTRKSLAADGRTNNLSLPLPTLLSNVPMPTKLLCFILLCIQIRIGSVFNGAPGSVSGSRFAIWNRIQEDTNYLQHRKRVNKFNFLKYWMFYFEGWRLPL